MLSDKFFEEYAKTGTPRPEEPADALLEDPEKDTYTRAEVDEIVNSKVAAAVDEVKAELNTIYGKMNKPVEPAEQN
jgi:hypothetical protein